MSLLSFRVAGQQDLLLIFLKEPTFVFIDSLCLTILYVLFFSKNLFLRDYSYSSSLLVTVSWYIFSIILILMYLYL